MLLPLDFAVAEKGGVTAQCKMTLEGRLCGQTCRHHRLHECLVLNSLVNIVVGRSSRTPMRMIPPDEDSWEAWTPEYLAAKLSGVAAHWYVVGGWALDLWHGKQRRDHEDLEFATDPESAGKIAAHLSELTFFEAKAGELTSFDGWAEIPDTAWQFWGADLRAGRWRIDMMLERGSASHWGYKRDPRITQPRDQAVRTSKGGTRYLAPANVLLFKAKHCREKDQGDFQAALPQLSNKDRLQLGSWLRLTHPEHDWLRYLDSV